LLLATELQNGSSDPTPINNSSDDGCLGGLVAIILTGIIKIIKAYFLYYFVPIQVIAATLLGYGFMLFFAIIGLPSIALVIIYVCVALMLISIPYWVILFAQKRKKRMGWGETFKYYGKWFLKGPFAYKDIMKLKNN